MKISSSAFNNLGTIPAKYTCEGDDVNPPLSFSDIPANAVTLVLIMDDPDASVGTWIHWLLWNICPDTTEIAEDSIPAEAISGTTSSGNQDYGGPCPPSGTHRYFFKLFALDIKLNLNADANKQELETAIQGHIIEQAELVGLYQLKNN